MLIEFIYNEVFDQTKTEAKQQHQQEQNQQLSHNFHRNNNKQIQILEDDRQLLGNGAPNTM